MDVVKILLENKHQTGLLYIWSKTGLLDVGILIHTGTGDREDHEKHNKIQKIL